MRGLDRLMGVAGEDRIQARHLVRQPQGEFGMVGEATAQAFVLGAIRAGAHPQWAIELACKECVWVRGPVQVERLEPL